MEFTQKELDKPNGFDLTITSSTCTIRLNCASRPSRRSKSKAVLGVVGSSDFAAELSQGLLTDRMYAPLEVWPRSAALVVRVRSEARRGAREASSQSREVLARTPYGHYTAIDRTSNEMCS